MFNNSRRNLYKLISIKRQLYLKEKLAQVK